MGGDRTARLRAATDRIRRARSARREHGVPARRVRARRPASIPTPAVAPERCSARKFANGASGRARPACAAIYVPEMVARAHHPRRPACANATFAAGSTGGASAERCCTNAPVSTWKRQSRRSSISRKFPTSAACHGISIERPPRTPWPGSRSTIRRDPVASFDHEVWVWFFAGIVKQRWRDSRTQSIPRRGPRQVARRPRVCRRAGPLPARAKTTRRVTAGRRELALWSPEPEAICSGRGLAHAAFTGVFIRCEPARAVSCWHDRRFVSGWRNAQYATPDDHHSSHRRTSGGKRHHARLQRGALHRRRDRLGALANVRGLRAARCRRWFDAMEPQRSWNDMCGRTAVCASSGSRIAAFRPRATSRSSDRQVPISPSSTAMTRGRRRTSRRRWRFSRRGRDVDIVTANAWFLGGAHTGQTSRPEPRPSAGP